MENFKPQKLEAKEDQFTELLMSEMTREQFNTLISKYIKNDDRLSAIKDIEKKLEIAILYLAPFASIEGTDEEIESKFKIQAEYDEYLKIRAIGGNRYKPEFKQLKPRPELGLATMSRSTIEEVTMLNVEADDRDTLFDFLLNNSIIQERPATFNDLNRPQSYFIKSAVSSSLDRILRQE